VTITLSNQDDSEYRLTFEMFDTNIAKKWLLELQEFIEAGQPFDDRKRFYNFPNSEFTEEFVVDYLNQLVDTINAYSPDLVKRRASIGMDQDTLNYLHHIFEVYHGLYDQQSTNQFFMNAPASVRTALTDLNIWVHRYESLNGMPRFVGTWYGKPCRKPLSPEDLSEFSLVEQWGDLKINYCEVGKTFYDLYHDEDEHIDIQAFKPLHFYSVDFTVRFTEESEEYYETLTENIWRYYDKNESMFKELGYSKYDPNLSLGWITVGRLVTAECKEAVITKIADHQYIKAIRID